MHEFRVGDFAIQLNNWQACVGLFLAMSGLGFVGSLFMVAIEIIRWSYWS